MSHFPYYEKNDHKLLRPKNWGGWAEGGEGWVVRWKQNKNGKEVLDDRERKSGVGDSTTLIEPQTLILYANTALSDPISDESSRLMQYSFLTKNLSLNTMIQCKHE